jgi:hypothetical protein
MILTKQVTCRCNACNGEIEFEASRAGETITCPICAMDTTLYIPHVATRMASAPPPNFPATQQLVQQPVLTAPIVQTHATKIKKRSRVGWFSMIEIGGWLITVPSAFCSLGGVLVNSLGMFFVFGVFTVAGVAMLYTARKLSTRYLCSACMIQLPNKEVRLCPNCKLPLLA